MNKKFYILNNLQENKLSIPLVNIKRQLLLQYMMRATVKHVQILWHRKQTRKLLIKKTNIYGRKSTNKSMKIISKKLLCFVIGSLNSVKTTQMCHRKFHMGLKTTPTSLEESLHSLVVMIRHKTQVEEGQKGSK